MLLLWSLSQAAPVEAVGEQCTLASTVKVETEDGATIALHHHLGRGPPVIAVHGIASNHVFWDLDHEHSLARWLSDHDWDVWLLDLRGHGDAQTDMQGRPQLSGWKVDNYGEQDVPAAVDRVKRCTGYRNVAYIGHSMGGMVGAIYMAHGGDQDLSANIAVGSPVAFPADASRLTGLARFAFAAGGTALLWFATPMAADLAAVLGPAVPGRLQERLYNKNNMDPATINPMLQNIVSPLSRGEMRQFAHILKDGSFKSFHGETDYLSALGKVTVPTLVIAGEGDEVAPAAWVQPYATAMGGETRFVLAGPSNGFAQPYGHLDMGLGARVSTEVFPVILDWLNAHKPVRP